ncbi:hypothetical protein NSP77_26065, partial [Salmonella enterica]|nr:hypothetical protein [Salmonella enterica]
QREFAEFLAAKQAQAQADILLLLGELLKRAKPSVTTYIRSLNSFTLIPTHDLKVLWKYALS